MPSRKPKVEPIEEEILVDNADRNKVYVERSITKNLGDYNSVKIAIGVTMGVNPSKQELVDVKNAITKISTLIDNEMDEQLSTI